LKNLIIGLFVFVSAYAAHQHGDPPSVHGMLVVGNDRLYLSHLPMFHSPHDYQVILEAELDPEAAGLYRSSKAANEEPVYTIAPESGVLPEMAQAGRSFKAALYRGHFERGGVQIAAATVRIVKVLYFKKFDPLAGKDSSLKFILFGNAREQFAAHVITAKPDFDQILETSASEDLDGRAEITAFANLVNEPLRGQIRRGKNLRIGRAIYTETGDLSF
jgi:hypothetical protein